jgi:ribosomal protein S27AE
MAHLTTDLYVVQARYGNIAEDTSEAWLRAHCPNCGGAQAAVVAYTADHSERPRVTWGRCVNCFRGFVVNGFDMSPSALPLNDVRGLDGDTRQAWVEVRNCLSVGATTAAVHMCRKILFHVAVEKGLDAKNDKGRAPTFIACIEHLQEHGYVTPPMARWVTKIKDVGNEAAHELAPIPVDQAELVATFTMQLLILTYQMPSMLAETSFGNDAADESTPV